MITFDSSRYQLIANALNSAGGFADGSYLVQYPRESADKFQRRKDVAWYHNALRPACQRFAGYLAKRPPQRSIPQPALAEFADRCNWQDDSLDVFWSGFMLEAKARGTLLLLVDMPKAGDARTWPVLTALEPERIARYSLTHRGELAEVVLTDTMEIDGTQQTVERSYTQSDWSVTQGDDIIEQGSHALGVCPVLVFSESGRFPDYGEFANIADLSKRLYNLRSELDEILRSQTFSLLTYKVPAEHFPIDLSGVAQTIGTNNLLQTYPEGADFIAPPEGPARVYLDVIQEVAALIRQTALIVDLPDSRANESGVALQLRFQSLNASLVHFARRMEDLERRMWSIVGLWLGIEPKTVVTWGKDFSIADLATEIEVAQNMNALGAPPSYQTTKLRQLIQLDLAGLPDAQVQEALKGVDEMTQENAGGTGA